MQPIDEIRQMANSALADNIREAIIKAEKYIVINANGGAFTHTIESNNSKIHTALRIHFKQQGYTIIEVGAYQTTISWTN